MDIEWFTVKPWSCSIMCPVLSAYPHTYHTNNDPHYTFVLITLHTYIQDLAQACRKEPNFLIVCGVSERDADEIALQVSHLGLSYHPVTDFSNAETIESAVYVQIGEGVARIRQDGYILCQSGK